MIASNMVNTSVNVAATSQYPPTISSPLNPPDEVGDEEDQQPRCHPDERLKPGASRPENQRTTAKVDMTGAGVEHTQPGR